MNFPIPVSTLMSALPHRPPMIWIDEVLSATAEGGEARVTLKKDAAYFDAHGVRHTAFIEWIAQACGYITAAHHFAHGQQMTAKRAFLAGIKDAKWNVPDLKVGDVLKITIDQVRPMGSLTMLRGRVFHGDRPIGEANLRLFSEP